MKQEVTFFTRANLPIALSLLLDTSASMESRLDTAQEAAIGFAQDAAPAGSCGSHRLRQPRHHPADRSRTTLRQLEQAIRKTSAGGSTSMYNAIYIALKDLKKVVATTVEDVRRQAVVVLSDGEDTSSLLPFEEVLDLAKRSETAIYAIGLRSGEGSGASRGFREAEFVLRQLAQETGGPRLLPERGRGAPGDLQADLGRAVEPVHGRLQLAQSEARRRVAPRRRPDRPARHCRAHQAGLLRPDRLADPMNFVPLAFYTAALVAYALHFTRRQAPVGRTATTLLVFAALAHTFVIGMQTMDVGHVPFANASAATSTLRPAARARLSLRRDDDRRARDGRVHPAAAGRAAGDPGIQSGARGARRAALRARCSTSTCRRCSLPTPASRSPA